MPKVLTRVLPWICGIALVVGIKWAFDRLLWDTINRWLDHTTDFEKAELFTAVLSYLIPLTIAVLVCARVFPRDTSDDSLPVLRKHPWQSRRLIAGALIIVAALIAGSSYGRVFGLPFVTLPSSGQ